MLRNRMVGASLVLALAAGIAAGLLLSRPSPAQHLAAAQPAATQVPASPTDPAGTPPPLPDAVLHPPHLIALHGSDLNLTLPCNKEPGPAVDWVPPSRGWPTTLPELYAESPTVVLATLIETHGYWQHDDGHLVMNLTGMDWTTFTVTNFTVQHVYKGSAGPWLQTVDVGANPDNVAVCPNRAPIRGGWPLPATTRQQYVLFLQRDGDEGMGPIDRWPVIDGIVHPDHDIQPRAIRMDEIRTGHLVGPMPLDQFIAAMQGT